MRWSIIRLIWLRELRDQLRDRRTVFMIAVLPILLYPVAGFGVMQLALGFLNQKSVVGVAGAEHLLPWTLAESDRSPAGAACWLAVTPPPPGVPLAGAERLSTAAALYLGRQQLDFPPLLEEQDGHLAFVSRYTDSGGLVPPLSVRRLDGPVPDGRDPHELAAPFRAALDDRKVDLLLIVPPGFQDALRAGGQPTLTVLTRPKDETSRLVSARFGGALSRWRRELKEARLTRLGLPPDFDQPIHVQDPQRAKAPARQESENLFGVLVRVFPFVLVMWSLAGALYPAVDLCAGEKERGTMETLLISPASREEIVWGKFLTIWLFSAATAFLNLLSMALTTSQVGAARGGSMRLEALLWGLLLLLPLSAFFSAVCLAVGAYARSSKEGQYYLMPLFLVTMPLIFLTLAPGVELNPFYSMVPVTGVALLLQRLVSAEGPDHGVWFYFVPVLAPMVIYSWLALRWAIEQFQREEVLFREAERLDLGLWLKRLLREKEALPSAGEALFCFAIILALGWLSFGVGQNLPLLTRTGIRQVAFVAAPPLFMALLLTTRPWIGLGVRLPPWWAWPAAAALAVLVLPPLAELTLAILRQFPALKTLLELNHPLTRELQSLTGGGSRLWYFVMLGLLPAVCEELAFRGFILQGLLRGFRPWTAILLSAFLFALYQMNVFQFVPHFVIGVVLGLIVVRTGSVLPAILFHLVYNSSLILIPAVLRAAGLPTAESVPSWLGPWRVLLSTVCLVLAGAGLGAVWWLGRRPREVSA
jgi:sodium transport system permease protein